MSEQPAPDDPHDAPLRRASDFLTNAAIVGVIKLALALPYAARVRFVGWLVERVIGPVAGYRRRALHNLALIFPSMPEDQRAAIATRCLNNVGRTFIENYSDRDFPNRMADITPHGPGAEALKDAVADGRPVILVTGHFGNYEATRAALVAQGYDIGGLYRDMKNPYFNAHYVKTMEAFGGPVFPQGRRGTAGFVRHLKGGGQLVLLFDQHVYAAPVLDFLGLPARTALSAAELALRYDALLIPFYGIRQPDGLSFDAVLEAPIQPSDAETMTQALNDSLAARVREMPEQWFWVHRRWRGDEV
ncbi:putative lipid A biosynthesis lauroyl acyltransferase [Sulfitobacter noctilucae]|uniref:lysophospholipid acyltransferase family protein n=1 Tax=Sulfitobacter noctilucae TaxID=1342302 RepID=UPI00046ADB1C|nr:lysophospholipid acyltransferase family protein [Sulfitobacter noctilucae]KIN60616.1 putative lipid A biosynthesis lauroyl acyltransferase [Sulfitobacter noctilucae]